MLAQPVNKTKLIPERQRLQILYERYRAQYDTSLRKTNRRLRKMLIKTDINFNIKTRLKNFNSYFEKILRLRKAGHQPIILSDVMGLRIICPFLEDVNHIEQMISENFNVVEVEHKSEKNSFREFSYDSVHLLVEAPLDGLNGKIPYVEEVCEIQLRTILQDAWAEVEHELIYKANFSLLNESIKRKLASLNASLTLSDIIFQEIRDYQKEIAQLREKCQDSMLEKVFEEDELIPAAAFPVNDRADEKEAELPSLSAKPKSELERLLFEALEAHGQNKLTRSIQIYSRILRMRLKPHVRSIIYNHRGMAYFSQAKYEKAIRDFDRSIDSNAKSARAYNNRGLSYRMLKNYDKAISDFNRSLEINAFQPEAHHIRALTFFDLHDYARALDDCDRALNIKEDFDAARNLRELIIGKLNF